jgi:CRISPR-associated protein Csm2
MAEWRQRDRGGDRRNEGPSAADKIAQAIKDLKGLSEKDFDTEKLVKWAAEMGDFLANHIRLKTSQIRKFLDAVNEIRSKGVQKPENDSFFRSQCMLLKPKLAYAAGRQPDTVKPLMVVLEPCIDKVHNKADFTRFYRFMEAIIAYHRYHGVSD